MRGWHANPSWRPQSSTKTTGSSQTTNVTSGTTNTKGTWTSLALTPACELGFLNVSCIQWDGNDDIMIDIGQGDGTSGGTTIIVPDLHVPGFGSASLLAGNMAITIPVRVPGGVALYVRTACSSATRRHNVAVRGGPGFLGQPGFGQCVSLFTPGSSRGTLVDPGGSANTPGSWTSITTGVAKRIGAYFLVIGNAGDASRTAMNWLIDVGVGANPNQYAIGPSLVMSCANALPGLYPFIFGPFSCDVAASTAWWVRAQCSSTTSGDRTFDVSLYGLVP